LTGANHQGRDVGHRAGKAFFASGTDVLAPVVFWTGLEKGRFFSCSQERAVFSQGTVKIDKIDKLL
jgi:hypothetical protein